MNLKVADQTLINDLASKLDLDPLVVRTLVLRGLSGEEIAELLIPAKLTDPKKLSNMNKAVDRIIQAMEKKEKIVICGDYDVDGAVATAIMHRFFTEINYPVHYYIPKRLEEGYGISALGIEKLKNEGADLLISVDNGIAAFDAGLKAKELNIDLIITDHHDLIDGKIPEAFTVVNPKIDNLPNSKFLSGAGVAFYLITQINRVLKKEVNLKKYLVLTMIASITDVVPLLKDNRAIVKMGLALIKTDGVPGLKALFSSVGLSYAQLTAKDIGYKIGPILNAAGRLEGAEKTTQLLIEDDPDKIELLIADLKRINLDRRKISNDAVEKYMDSVDPKQEVIVVSGDIHQGVLGIVAARIKEKYNKPTIIIGFDAVTGTGKASCRSINGFNIKSAIEAASEFHLGGGGHYMAAGFSIRKDQVEDFTRSINEYAKDKIQEKEYEIDLELTIDDITEKFVTDMKKIEPFGAKIEYPKVKYSGQVTHVMILKDEHIMLTVDGKVKALAFFAKDINQYRRGDYVDLIGEMSPERNSIKLILDKDD